MEVKKIEGPVIIFESKDRRAQEKAMKAETTAAAFLNRQGRTVIVVKCLYGNRPKFYGDSIARDYLKTYDLKMRRVGQNPHGIDVQMQEHGA